MKNKAYEKISTPVLVFLALITFIATLTNAQTRLRATNGKIAFTSDRDGNREIYVINIDGRGQTRLTDNSTVDDHPTWSPDGKKIAFVGERRAGGFAIYLMDADGANQMEVTPVNYNFNAFPISDVWGMSWSPDGKRIAFQQKVEPSNSSTYPNDILIVDVDGTNRRVLVDDPEDERQPAWSPDGSKILFTKAVSPVSGLFHNLFTVKPDGTDLRPLASVDTYTDLAATWSPAGDQIAFQEFDYANSVNIVVANADGEHRYVFDYGGGFKTPGGRNKPDWSPDGKRIVFHVARPGNTEIFAKNADGTGFVQLTNTPGNNFKPSWQPLVSAPTLPDFDGDEHSNRSFAALAIRTTSTRNAVESDPAPFKALISGSAAFTSPTRVEFHGEGQATHLGRFVSRGEAILGPSTGTCPGDIPNVHTETLTAANGDELVIRMVNVACPTGPFTVQGTGHWTVLSGTGRFQDVTGQGTIRGNADFESSIFELTPDRNPLQKLDDSRRWCCGLRVTANPLHGRIFLSR